jgi:tetratricopeptide (TPR) repeat protein
VRKLSMAGLLAVLFVTGYGANQRLEGLETGEPDRDHLLYLPSGRLLRVLSLGQDDTLADLIYLWSIQYYGYYQGGVRYDYLMQIYDRVITELDPRFQDAYLLGAMILSMEAQRHDEALQLLDKGIRENPGDWLLPFEAGFIAYSSLRDYRRAAAYFRVAMERPGVSPVVRRFYAEMFNRMGDPRTSLQHWNEILDTAGSDYVRRIASRHVRDLTTKVRRADLQAAVDAFRDARGHPPARLQDLVDADLLPQIPLDAEGRPFRYDPAAGAVQPPEGASGFVP